MWLARGSLVCVSRQNTLPKGSSNKENRCVNTNRFRIKVLTKEALPVDLAPQTIPDVTDPLSSVKECVDLLFKYKLLSKQNREVPSKSKTLGDSENFLLGVSSWQPGLSPPERLAG